MDLIDRQAAIENSFEVYTKEYGWCEVVGVDAINSLPSAQPEQRWIPCSERLPKDVQIGDEYPAVIFCTKEKTYAGFYEYYLDGRWWAEDGDYVVDDVIAWMPLPKPYKGGQDGH